MKKKRKRLEDVPGGVKYCDCGKLTKFIPGNFLSEDGEYKKFICDSCGKIHKEFLKQGESNDIYFQ